MSNEYQPLARLIEQGLEPGTVLESSAFEPIPRTWAETGFEFPGNPFDHKWRIVSTPPKRIEFKTTIIRHNVSAHEKGREDVRGEGYTLEIVVPNDAPFNAGDNVKVTVEGI